LNGFVKGFLKNFLFFFRFAEWQFFAFFLPSRKPHRLDEHFHYIKYIERKHCRIKDNEVQLSRLEAGGGSNCRTDEEQNIHIQTKHYSNSTGCIDRSNDVGDVKLIGFVEVEVFAEFLKHFRVLSFFLSVNIIAPIP
jgi:hypothetical protein